MAYYNFNRIIKYLIHKITHVKIWKISLLLFVLLFLFSSFNICFGSVNFTGINNKTYILPDEFFDYKYIIVYSYNWHIEVVASDTKPYAHFYTNENNQVTGIIAGFKDGNTPFIRVTAGNQNVTDFSAKTVEYSTPGNNSYNANADIYSIYGASGGGGTFQIQGSNYDVLDSITGQSIFTATEQPNIVSPFISNPTEELTNLSFNNLYVELGDYDISQSPLYLHVLQINNTVTENDKILYYYGDHIIKLSQNDKYYKQLFDTTAYYFSIPKNKLNLDVDSSYLLVLDNSSKLYENSYGLIETNVEENIFDVREIDTAGVLTQAEVDHNNFLNMQESLHDIQSSVNDNTITNETSDNVSVDMNFSNDNPALNNLNNGFFTRLTSEINQIIDYDLSTVSTLSLPVPFTNQSITIRSDIVSAYLPEVIKTIINAMWLYIFTFYLYKFINKIYISFKSGNILNAFSSNDEIITSSML